MSFYKKITSIMFCVGVSVCVFTYVIKSERQIKTLQHEVQLNQVTIDTINALLEKQKKIVRQSNDNLIEERKNKRQLETLKKKNQVALNKATEMQQKQELLNNILYEIEYS